MSLKPRIRSEKAVRPESGGDQIEALLPESLAQEGDDGIQPIGRKRIVTVQKHGQNRRPDTEDPGQGITQTQPMDLGHQRTGSGAIDEKTTLPAQENQMDPWMGR